MMRWLATAAIAAALAACGASPEDPPASAGDDDVVSGIAPDVSSIVANGSFETGDYTGWTLQEAPLSPTSGTWGIATNGQTIPQNAVVFDFADQTQVSQSSPGLPITYQATDGNFVAFQLQNGGQDHRMFQTIALPACQPLLFWDMAYNNHNTNFDPNGQFIAVNLRDPSSDAITSTVFQTQPGAPVVVSPMTSFQADLTAFSGQTVRLDYEMLVDEFYFDASFDNIRIICKGISASPGTVDFGTEPLGATTAAKTVIVTNFASTSLTLSSLGITPEFSIAGAPSLPLTLAPNASTTINVKFKPTASGTQTGALTIKSDDPNGNTVVQLTGIGAGSPQLTTASEIDFADIQVGDTREKDLLVTNTGNATLDLSAIDAPSPFSVTTDSPLPIALAVGAQATLHVTFAPVFGGQAVNQLQLTSDDPASPTIVTLTGTGDPSTLGVDQTSLAFGGERVNTTSAAQAVRATNTGTGALTISQALIDPQFAVSSVALPITLAPGDFVDFAVTFTPTAEGPVTGQLAIVSTAAVGPATVSLAGAGIAPHIAVSPSPVAFGNQRVGTTGAQAVVVTNTGTDVLTVSSVTTAAPFADADATPFQLAPNTSQTLAVTFHPIVQGGATGTLTLASDDAATPSLAVGMSGAGVIGLVTIVPGAVHFANQRRNTASAPQTVTITNSGTDTLTIASATLSGGPFSASAPSAHVLAPGASAQLSVTFTPTADGNASSTLSVVSDAPSSPDSIGITGTGVEPLATVAPTSLAFGTQRTNTTSASKSFTLSNPGTSTLTVSALATTGPFAATGPALPFTIAPGQTQAIGVTFAPTTAGATIGSVTITTDATTTPSVGLSGTGVEPTIGVSATTLAFGSQRLTTTSAPQTVTLTNTGSSPLTISGASAPAAYVLTPPASFPIAVLPGGHAIFTVRFAPTALGPANGDLVITSDAAASPTDIALTGAGVKPVVQIAPSTIGFGDVRVGQTSAATTVTISNPGSDPFTVTNISLSPPFARTAVPFPATVAPNATLTFDVTFSPTTRATASSAITVATDTGFASVPVTGRGVAPLIAAAPSPLAFGVTTIGQPASATLTLSNGGTAPLVVSGLVIAGTNAGDFTIPTGPALPVTVPAGATLPLAIQFAPGDHGVRSAQLTATSDALGTPALVIALSGTGQGPHVSITPDALELGAINVGDTTDAKSITVSNSGETDLVISQIVLAGASGGDFTATATLPLTITAGATASVGFTFTPSAVGARAATATIVTNDSLTAAPTVALTGTGLAPTIAVSPASLAFGNVRVGEAGTLALVVSNPGTGPLTISALVLSGPDVASVTLDAQALPLVIAPATSHTVHVSFTPTLLASASASLAIVSDDAAAPSVAIPITGTGVSPSVAVSPSTLDFGAQLAGHTSAPRVVHVKNIGTGVLTVSALAITGAQASTFSLVTPPALPATVAAGASLDVSLAVAPTAVAADAADLAVTTDSPDAPDAVAHLTALGISTALTVTPTSIAFGSIHAGALSTAMPVTLTNLTNDPITLIAGALTGPRPGDFTLSPVAGALAPGASISEMVTYAPATAAVSAATLTISATDPAIPSAVIALAGTAVSSFVTVDHMTVDFGAFEVGDHSGPKAVAVTNVTTAAITIAGIASSDPQFVVDDSAALAPLAPGASASFTIAYAPTAEGSAMASVAITLVGATTPELAVTATGTATAKPSEGCNAGSGGRSSAFAVLLALGLVTLSGRGRGRRAHARPSRRA